MSDLALVGCLSLSALIGWLAHGVVRAESGVFGLAFAFLAGLMGIVAGGWYVSLIYTTTHGPLIVSGGALAGLAFLIIVARFTLLSQNKDAGQRGDHFNGAG